ncbi:MAG TPA: L-lactate dehydrogenase [Anaerolineales bacterium]|nr:L-lactate dehydrogenase [Anaerolineales bacterium]
MEANIRHPVRVAVVGAGQVGATCAYTLLLRGIVSEIVLITKNHDHAEGEAMDLNHGMLFARPARIWAGDFDDCVSADIVVLAAGAAQSPGETRMDLLKRNAALIEDILPKAIKHNQDAILVLVTNPVDVMTHIAREISGFPPERVIGSGTVLDTARLRYLLSQRLHVEPRSVHAFVIGEHGDTQVVVWSLANVAGIRLDDYDRRNGRAINAKTKTDIAELTRNAAYEVIRRKGATYYAIAAGVSRIVEAITRDENSVLTVSSLVEGHYGLSGVSLSLPRVVNQRGVAHTLELPLNRMEQAALEKSALTIKAAITSLGYAG